MRTKKRFGRRQKNSQPARRICNPTLHDDGSPNNRDKMASVYKSISKANGEKSEGQNGVRKNKQRVLILSSRGVTYR